MAANTSLTGRCAARTVTILDMVINALVWAVCLSTGVVCLLCVAIILHKI